MNDAYRFPGITKFLGEPGTVHPNLVGKIGSLWFVARARDALSQLPEAPVSARPDLLRVAVENREALALALTTLDAAIEEVRANCFPEPEPTPEPEPEPLPSTTSAPVPPTQRQPQPKRREGGS